MVRPQCLHPTPPSATDSVVQCGHGAWHWEHCRARVITAAHVRDATAGPRIDNDRNTLRHTCVRKHSLQIVSRHPTHRPACIKQNPAPHAAHTSLVVSVTRHMHPGCLHSTVSAGASFPPASTTTAMLGGGSCISGIGLGALTTLRGRRGCFLRGLVFGRCRFGRGTTRDCILVAADASHADCNTCIRWRTIDISLPLADTCVVGADVATASRALEVGGLENPPVAVAMRAEDLAPHACSAFVNRFDTGNAIMNLFIAFCIPATASARWVVRHARA